MKNFMRDFLLFCAFGLVALILIGIGSAIGVSQHEGSVKVKKDSILTMKLEGVIYDTSDFLENLRKYSKKKHIKGVLIRLDSPGGVVGPSQEIYHAILKVREELQKPVVVSCGALTASGAYYAAVAADQIVTNEGTLMGSIGVIMQFSNMQRLFSWAKMEFYNITTGRYKDSGTPNRPMREDEKQLFQSLIYEVHDQFKAAVVKGRKLTTAVVDKYADGRIFTGETAVKLGFADQVGTYHDSIRLIGELSGLGDEPELFEPPKPKRDFWKVVSEMEGHFSGKSQIRLPDQLTQLLGKPLYLMPGFYQ